MKITTKQLKAMMIGYAENLNWMNYRTNPAYREDLAQDNQDIAFHLTALEHGHVEILNVEAEAHIEAVHLFAELQREGGEKI